MGKARAKSSPAAERRHPVLLGEIVAILLLAVAVISGLALATHEPQDASWGADAGTAAVSNAVGPFGANLSLALLESVGLVAYLVPITLLILALSTFLRRRLPLGLGRLAGGVLLVLSAAALASLGLGETGAAVGFDFPPGGFLGRLMATGMAAGLGVAGAWVIALAVAFCSLLLMTRLSLRTAVEGTAGLAAQAGTGTASVFSRLSDRLALRWRGFGTSLRDWREARATRRAEARAAAAAAPPRPRPVLARPAPAAARPAQRRGLLLRLRLGRGRNPVEPPVEAVAAAAVAPAPAPRLPGAGSDGPDGPQPPAPPPAERLFGDEVRSPKARAVPRRSSDSEFVNEAAREVLATSDDGTRPAVGMRAQVVKAVHRSKKPRDFRLPPTNLLEEAGAQTVISEEELMTCAGRIVDKCAEFGIGGQILQVHPGPVVTTFELKPDAGVKLSRIVGLEDDLAMALRAETIRIDRIPGKSTIGIEVPNSRRESITFRELAESDVFEEAASKVTMILGKTIDGAPYVADLARMPHLLIAGSTGSGKSVCLNSMITSILYKARPEEVKLIMVDPKMLELGMYADIPHLLTPVVTNPKLASNALKWAVREMENRYARLAQCGVRNIEQYNAWVKKNTKGEERPKTREGEDHEPLPFVVIVIDELADLMMIAAGDVEDSICRLAQMARAVGIHLILATQRPSVDVITGVIKANLPARIAMRVASKVDSRTILDSNGGEQLLGKGDMLFLPAGSSRLLRLHGPYLSEVETEHICEYLRTQRTPTYDESVCDDPAGEKGERGGGEKDDELFEAAARLVVERGEASVSYLQRRLKVGYSRAARLVDMLEDDSIVGPSEGSKVRQVLVGPDYFTELDRHRNLAGSP